MLSSLRLSGNGLRRNKVVPPCDHLRNFEIGFIDELLLLSIFWLALLELDHTVFAADGDRGRPGLRKTRRQTRDDAVHHREQAIGITHLDVQPVSYVESAGVAVLEGEMLMVPV